MSRLWDRGETLDQAVLRLTVGRDPELDLRLVEHDALASTAHAVMLHQVGVLTREELRSLAGELAAIGEDARAGRFAIATEQEDGHTAIEVRLTQRLGPVGKKIHTGRSRNDQVICALRLWGRRAVLEQAEAVLEVARRLLELAARHRETSLPGYTHTRQAMATTLGHHLGAWAESLLDNLPWLRTAFAHLNRCPLGAASGFGVGLELDRPLVSRLLGFDRIQENTLSVQNDRGKSEYLALSAAAAAATDLGRLAHDLIWLSSDELGFVALSGQVTTGSSIMPQKRNPDVLELIRAAAARLRSRQAEVGAIYGGLPAGYHRDLQLTKEPFLEGMQSLIDACRGLCPVLDGLSVDRERCRSAVLPATGATDAVYRRVAAGEAFRDAYRALAAGDAADELPAAEAWRGRTHLGAPGHPGTETAAAAVEEATSWLSATRRRLPESVEISARTARE